MLGHCYILKLTWVCVFFYPVLRLLCWVIVCSSVNEQQFCPSFHRLCHCICATSLSCGKWLTWAATSTCRSSETEPEFSWNLCPQVCLQFWSLCCPATLININLNYTDTCSVRSVVTFVPFLYPQITLQLRICELSVLTMRSLARTASVLRLTQDSLAHHPHKCSTSLRWVVVCLFMASCFFALYNSFQKDEDVGWGSMLLWNGLVCCRLYWVSV